MDLLFRWHGLKSYPNTYKKSSSNKSTEDNRILKQVVIAYWLKQDQFSTLPEMSCLSICWVFKEALLVVGHMIYYLLKGMCFTKQEECKRGAEKVPTVDEQVPIDWSNTSRRDVLESSTKWLSCFLCSSDSTRAWLLRILSLTNRIRHFRALDLIRT